jgi:hypothetical protein
MTKDTAAKARESKKRQGCRALHYLFSVLIVSVLMPSYTKAGGDDAVSLAYNRTPSQYKAYAVALGQRLLKAGKERITSTGFLAYSENLDKALPVEIIWQYPLKVRLTQSGSSLAFDLSNAAQKAPPSLVQAKTIEVLLEDSAEGLLSLRSTMGSTRYIGSGFRLPNVDAKGPGIDIVQTNYADVFRDGKQVVKTYWFSSETKLLGFVGYQSASGDQVDVVIDDWRDVDGEKVPFLIERWENSKLVMRIALSSAIVTAGSEDGTFGGK